MELITIKDDTPILKVETARQIVEFEKKAKYIAEQEKMLKNAILDEMQDKGIIKIDTEDLMISYIAPTDRETLDNKALKKDFPDLYDTYVEMKPVKASIRIKVK